MVEHVSAQKGWPGERVGDRTGKWERQTSHAHHCPTSQRASPPRDHDGSQALGRAGIGRQGCPLRLGFSFSSEWHPGSWGWLTSILLTEAVLLKVLTYCFSGKSFFSHHLWLEGCHLSLLYILCFTCACMLSGIHPPEPSPSSSPLPLSLPAEAALQKSCLIPVMNSLQTCTWPRSTGCSLGAP